MRLERLKLSILQLSKFSASCEPTGNCSEIWTKLKRNGRTAQKVLFFMAKKLALSILVSISGWSLNAQKNLDSLYMLWLDPTQSDSNRADAYNAYIWQGYLFSKPDTAAVLAEALVDYAKEQNYSKAAAQGYNLQGIANTLTADYTLALEYYEKSLTIQEAIGDKNGAANCLNNMGNIHLYQGNYPLALEYYEQSLAIREAIGDKKGIASSLVNIGALYQNRGNYPRALEYYQKTLAIRQEIGDTQGLSTSLNNIGVIYESQGNYSRALEYYQRSLAIEEETGNNQGLAYSLGNIGVIYQSQGNYSRALEYYQRSLAIEEETGNNQGLAYSLGNIGVIYQSQGNYSRALEYYQKSLAIQEAIGNKQGIASSLSNIGSLYREQGNYSRALDRCRKGLALAEEIGYLEEQKSSCQCLYDAYKDLGKGNEALVYLEKMRIVEDSLYSKETAKKLEQMEFAKVLYQDSITKAEEARLMQEAHQAEVRKKNQTRNVLIGATLLFLVLTGGLYNRWRFVRKSRDIISRERNRSEDLLLNILPAEIAEELKAKGRAEARNFDMVSILFTDFKGFTEQSAKLSPTELVNEINHCFEAFDGIMEKYGIEKIKTIGDAYMAAGGLPMPTDDSVKNTVLAALEMQHFIASRKAENEAAGRLAFEMRVGIHTGPVVAGIVGVKKFQYDIWGDTVNMASRMESNSEVGQVNISQPTYELLKDDPQFVFQNRGKIEAKGKGKIEMYFVRLTK